jgi:hypothetical protein
MAYENTINSNFTKRRIKMSVNNVMLAKEHPDIPNSYKIKFVPIVGNSIDYDVAEHHYMKEAVEYSQSSTGELIPIKFESMRAIELTLLDRRRIIIPFEAGRLEFSEDFDKLIEIRNKIKETGV